MTRARDELVLTHAADYGGQARRVSPFVLEALDLPVAAGISRRGRHGRRSPLERIAASEAPGQSPAAAAAGDEPLMLVLRDRRLPDLPAAVQVRPGLRVPLAPHHSMIYGSALHRPSRSSTARTRAAKS